MPLICLPPAEYVDDPTRFMQICRQTKDRGIAAVDTETTGLDPLRSKITYWSLCNGEDNRYAISRRLLPMFKKELVADRSIKWVMHNADFDRSMFENAGIYKFFGPVYCTMVMHWMMEDDLEHGLKPVAKELLGLKMRKFKSVFAPIKGEKEEWQTMERVMREDMDSAVDYASIDAWATFKIFHRLEDILGGMQSALSDHSLLDIYEKIEKPYSDILYVMKRRGVEVDRERLEETEVAVRKGMEKLQWEINKKVGRHLNPNSGKQLAKYFFDELGLKPIRMTKGGQSGVRAPSTDTDVMKDLSKQGFEVASLIVDYKALSKVHSDYCIGLVKHIGPDGRIHPTFNQLIRTGRISCRQPNLQNIKRPDEDEYKFRSMFIAQVDHLYLDADYSQLEMCVAAHLSNEPVMVEAIRARKDLHAANASLVEGIPYDDIIWAKKEADVLSKEHIPVDEWDPYIIKCLDARQDCKAAGFGILYGQGRRGLAEKRGVSEERAQEIIDKFFEPLPVLEGWIQDSRDFARENLCVPVLLGNIRTLKEANFDWRPGFYSKRTGQYVPERPGRRSAEAMRQSVNGQVQGAAAGIAKLAQLQIESDEVLDDLGFGQILQIHDEVLGEIPKENAKQGAARMEEVMANPFLYLDKVGIKIEEFRVPLTAEAGIGANWLEAH